LKLNTKYPLFDNANIAESFSGVCAPLTQDLVLKLYSDAFNHLTQTLALPPLENPVHFTEGRASYNLNSLKAFQSHGLRPLRLSLRILFTLIRLEKLSPDFNLTTDAFLRDQRQLCDQLTEDSSWTETQGELKRFIQACPRFSELPLINDALAFFLTQFLNRQQNETPSVLIEDAFDSRTRSMLRSIRHLQRAIENDLPIRLYLNSCIETNHFSFEMLKLRNEEFSYLLRDFLAEFGDRCPNELKLETKSYREYPLQFLKVLLSDPSKHQTQITSTSQGILNRFFVRKLRSSYALRESSSWMRCRAFGILRSYFLWFGERLKAVGAIESKEDIFYFKLSEIFSLNSASGDFRELIMDRRVRAYDQNEKQDPSSETRSSSVLNGEACSGGPEVGEVIVLKSEEDAEARLTELSGKIIVIPTAGPGLIHILMRSKGLIVEKGSIIAHSAILCRELGIPAIWNSKNACSNLKDHQKIRIDGQKGTIELISSQDDR
jgi:pyruvate,water dikinase